MLTVTFQLLRGSQCVTLQLTEGRPLIKGLWRRLPETSNVSLKTDSGFWENWPHGTPGGVTTVRLYDAEGAPIAHLLGYLTGRSEGRGRFLAEGSGGGFGDDEFSWMLLQSAALNRTPVDVGLPDVTSPARSLSLSAGRSKGY